jgi:vacuolar protein sorting-associated protein 13A/C
MASNITAGIRETTTVFEAGELVRERLPRYIGKDGIIIVSHCVPKQRRKELTSFI